MKQFEKRWAFLKQTGAELRDALGLSWQEFGRLLDKEFGS